MDDVFRSIATRELTAGYLVSTSAGTNTFLQVRSFTNGNVILAFGQSSAEDGKVMVFNAAGTQIFNLNAGAWSTWINSAVHIGSNTGATSESILKLTSTTSGFRMPVMTSVQRAAIGSPVVGLQVFDTDLQQICVYVTGKWQKCTQTDC